jgi:DNA topoisomerase-3
VEQFLRDKRIGPLQGFRSKAGWPFTAELALAYDEEEKNWKLEFDFGEDKNAETGEIVDFSAQEPLGPCPKCGHKVFEWGSNYVCERAVPTQAHPTPTCDFRSGKIILQQPVEREQMAKLLATGKTDLLDKFVSMRTRRAVQGLPGLGRGSGQGELRVRAARLQVPAAQGCGGGQDGAARNRGAVQGDAKAAKAVAARSARRRRPRPRRRPRRPRSRPRSRSRRARPAPA